MTKTQRKAINKMVKGKSCLRYSGGSEKRNNAMVKCIQLQLRNDCLWEVSRLFVCRRMNLSFPTNKWISGIWMHEIPIGIACNNYKIGLLIKTTLALFKKLLKSCLSFGGKSNEHLTICVVSMLLAAQKNEWKTAEQTETPFNVGMEKNCRCQHHNPSYTCCHTQNQKSARTPERKKEEQMRTRNINKHFHQYEGC